MEKRKRAAKAALKRSALHDQKNGAKNANAPSTMSGMPIAFPIMYLVNFPNKNPCKANKKGKKSSIA